MNWVDEKLVWTSNMSDLTFISLDPNDIWTPDLKLLNAATKPEIYTLKGFIFIFRRFCYLLVNLLLQIFHVPWNYLISLLILKNVL